MNAMLQQLDPKTVLTNFGDIAKAGKQIISTSIPASEVDTFINLSLKAKNQPISSVSFVPPVINTGDPDWDKIRDMVTDAIDKSEGREVQGDKSGADAKPKKQGQEGNANASKNLASAC